MKAAPSPLSVTLGAQPVGTAKIRVYVDGALAASIRAGHNVLVMHGVSTLGVHAIGVVALASDGRVLATLSQPVTVLAANDPTFRQNANRISRLWGNDEADEYPLPACYRMTAPST